MKRIFDIFREPLSMRDLRYLLYLFLFLIYAAIVIHYLD